jgi:UDP-glucose 4-epimerase
MAKILVTGGAGFIGSHVADAYKAQGHEVAILDNLSTGRKEYIPEGVPFYQADITDLTAVEQALSDFQPEIINHHAAHIQVGYSVVNPQFDATSNILGLLNVMQTAKELGTVKKVIMASTGGAMYGDQPVPFVETMSAQPLSPYGISKRSGELYLHFYAVQYGINYVVLRYSNVYGPRQNPHGESGVIAIFMEKLLKGEVPVINGDGTHTRDYVHVSDVAKANVLALEYAANGIFNIGTTTEITANEVFHLVTQAMQVDIPEQHGPARPGEQVRSSLDATLAKQELGWTPSIMFAEGVQALATLLL